jgi:DNA polymerase-3 subunit alpha
LLGAAKTTGIFQLESAGMRDLLLRLKPETFEELIALVALYRPGPLGSGMVDDFIKRKREKVPVKFQLPQLEEILKETYGVILYQEQVMKIANILANFSLAEADILRRAMGKKKIAEMEKLKDSFITGAKSNRISEKRAVKLFNDMANFAQYGFNKSHSAAYALIAYRTAYLKAHHPVEFIAAALSADMDNTTKIVTYINECKEMGIEILPPDINESKREFNAIGNSIRFGLEAVKGVGSSAIEAIISTRNTEKFTSFFDFCLRVDSRRVNKKVIESLIKAGALDSFGKRAQLTFALSSVMDSALKTQKENTSGQRSIFGTHQNTLQELPGIDEWSESERLMMEKDSLGFYITGHPLSRYKEKLERFSVTPTHKIQDLPDKEDVNVGGIPIKFKKIQTKKKGDLMAYITIEDLYGTIELIVFPDIYRESENIISHDTPIIIYGQTDKSDKGLKIIAKKIVSIEDEEQIIKHRTQNTPKKSRSVGTTRQLRTRLAVQAEHPEKVPKYRDYPSASHPSASHEASEASEASGTGRLRTTDYGQRTANSQFKALTLTVCASTNSKNLLSLKDILSRHSGNHPVPVYIKIISPNQWETLILAGQDVTPSEEMILEVENIFGKGTAVLS